MPGTPQVTTESVSSVPFVVFPTGKYSDEVYGGSRVIADLPH